MSINETKNALEDYQTEGATCSVVNMQLLKDSEPIHMTLEEVRNTLGSTSIAESPSNAHNGTLTKKQKKCRRKSFPASLKYHLKNIFSLKKSQSADLIGDNKPSQPSHSQSNPSITPVNQRTLPPVPVIYADGEVSESVLNDQQETLVGDIAGGIFLGSPTCHGFRRSGDFTSSIEKVKDCGWYWGPVNGDMAEKLLSTEPDGSFIVRDSSDEHYIFSLTFKLYGLVRHVRIEHDQGFFSFGSFQKFKSTKIVDFIENAVEHSRSGRYLFFLHRRPLLGPVRVQLLHPLSRFKHVQSLQHQCRFVILKQVRRDLICNLPLPECLKDYLSSPYYYSEEIESVWNQSSLLTYQPDNNHHQSSLSSSSSSIAIEQGYNNDERHNDDNDDNDDDDNLDRDHPHYVDPTHLSSN